LDSDDRITPRALNKLLRQTNVSVCVLRSRKAKYEDKAPATIAKVGHFKDLVTREWKSDPQRLGQNWDVACAHLEQEVVPQASAEWEVTNYVDTSTFRQWWGRTVDAVIQGTTWPLQCDQSIVSINTSEAQQLLLLQRDFHLKCDLIGCVVCTYFAILIGGTGSPPHIDTILTLHNREPPPSDNVYVHTCLAVGYIIQGFKYFWALPPSGGYAQKFIDFYRDRVPPDITDAQARWHRDISDGRVPQPFQGERSIWWPSETAWDLMQGDCNINNHFHRLIPDDRYLVVDGVFHSVWNDVEFRPVSVAHDDEWYGSQSDLNALQPTLGDTEITSDDE